MACFLVPMGEAIVTTIIQKSVKKETAGGWKLSWLNNMLWGGIGALAIEHVLRGEIVWWPPFLTAMQNPADIGPMLHETLWIGIPMALAITGIWGVMVALVRKEEIKAQVAKG